MKTLPSKVILVTGSLLLCATLSASPVTDWHTFKNTATTLSGQGTADPVMGALDNSASTAFLVGYLDTPLSLVNVGDQISLTYQISFNDAAGMGSGNDNFRFALYDLNGEAKVTADNTGTAGTTDTDGLRGYWFGVKSGGGTANGSTRKRTGTTADMNLFANASATANLSTPTGDRIVFDGAINGVGGTLYSGEMTLELTAGGVALSGCFGGGGLTNFFSALDDGTLGGASLANNFSAVAFFNGSSLSADQLLLQDVSVTYIAVPEPPSIVLAACGGLGLLLSCAARKRARGETI